ncbi:hypothetical protein VDG1235_4045 [Verrucomicrobiia bacterium DG1235]|nr:hypothetical protein VDG1235_4045 [Verrucomicrobiae bacterium DG1235]
MKYSSNAVQEYTDSRAASLGNLCSQGCEHILDVLPRYV